MQLTAYETVLSIE